jgi:hypothetical protein
VRLARIAAWIRHASDALQPGRLPVLAALLVAIATAGLLALAGTGPWRWGALAALATLILGGMLAAPWLLESRFPRYLVDYVGYYPPFPESARVAVAAEPDGLAVYMGRPRQRKVLPYGRIVNADIVELPGGRRALQFRFGDRITRRAYRMRFVFRDVAADRLLMAILRRQYREADTPWALWRSLEIDVACTPEELAAGAKRLVAFDRKVVCAWCAGIRGIRPDCPHCGGAGIRIERDVVEVAVRPRTPPGATLKFADMGNEDINGVRGPLTVRIIAKGFEYRA